MWEYLKLHELFIREALDGKHGDLPLPELKTFHEQQIIRMQHERLIHLIVTMSVALFFLLSVGYYSLVPSLPVGALTLLMLILLAAYIMHYFRLENGVQRWYHLSNRIDERLGVVSARYESGNVEAGRDIPKQSVSAGDRE